MTTFDSRVENILQKLKEKESFIQAEIKKVKASSKTNQRFSFEFWAVEVKHLGSLPLPHLKAAHAFLSWFKWDYVEEAEWNWYLVSDWIADIEAIIKKSSLEAELLEVRVAIAKADKHLSNDAKTNKDLLDIEKTFWI